MKKYFLKFRSVIKDRYPLLWLFVRAGATVILHSLSKRKIKGILKKEKELHIELGADKGRKGWYTFDISGKADLYWDLTFGIPLPNNSVSKIYSSHFLEHFSFKEIQYILDETRRVLVPGGIFSICVPNAKLYIDAYAKSDTLDEDYFIYKPGYHETTRIDYVNYMAYMNGKHKYMFDTENLIYLLQAKGFKNAHLRKFDPSLDLKKHDYESIYAEAVK